MRKTAAAVGEWDIKIGSKTPLGFLDGSVAWRVLRKASQCLYIQICLYILIYFSVENSWNINQYCLCKKAADKLHRLIIVSNVILRYHTQNWKSCCLIILIVLRYSCHLDWQSNSQRKSIAYNYGRLVVIYNIFASFIWWKTPNPRQQQYRIAISWSHSLPDTSISHHNWDSSPLHQTPALPEKVMTAVAGCSS